MELEQDHDVILADARGNDIRRTRFDGYMVALKEFLGEVFRS